MKTFTKRLPVIIDLQPEPQDVVLRLPEWMKYLFILLYVATTIGLALLLRESIQVFKLYQETVQARRTTEETVRQINLMQIRLAENKSAQKDYDLYKLRQRQNIRPGPLLDWIPTLVGKTQRAHTITIEQKGDNLEVRVALEKPIAETIGRVTNAPDGYTLQSSVEETPQFNELPQGQKANLNNEFVALVLQLKKQ